LTPKRRRFAQNSKAHHGAYFEKGTLEAARGAAFAEIPRFCNLIIVRGFSVMVG